MQEARNHLIDINKVYSEAPSDWATLVDLGSVYVYSHIGIACTFNKDIQLKYNSDNSIFLIPSGFGGFAMTKDRFQCTGVISWRYVSDAPTFGLFKLTAWTD